MPWKLESPEQLVKSKSLVLRHSVTECKYNSSPDGMWQFEGYVSTLEKLIRIHTKDTDPRTARGDILSGVYHANKSSPWDKLVITDPVFVSSKLHKNGKFELELASGEMATEDRVNERFHQSAIVERDGRNYWKVLQIYGGHLVGSWTLHTAIGGVMLGGNRMLDLATGRIFIYKRKGKLVLHSKGRMGRLYDK